MWIYGFYAINHNYIPYAAQVVIDKADLRDEFVCFTKPSALSAMLKVERPQPSYRVYGELKTNI